MGNMMDFEIRTLKKSEYPLLEDFLYKAIYIPQGQERPSRNILRIPEMQVYLENFGSRSDDSGLAAVIDEQVIGVVWGRIMNDYGHIDDKTPSLALAVHEMFRDHGIGTALMKAMLDLLRINGYRQVSLSVQKSNPAIRLYKRLGFETYSSVMGETEEEIIMKHRLY